MIPQKLDGNNVTADIYFTDNTTIHVTLKGSWAAGTTRTYKLSDKNSNWEYVLTADGPSAAGFSDTQTDAFTIQSYRHANGSQNVPIPWEVVGYSEDNGNTWTTNKPAWLRSLSKERSNGSVVPEQGTATLIPAQPIDLLAARNKELQTASPLGTATAPYNLSNKTGGAAVEKHC